MNNLCQRCKIYYYVRGWDADDINAICRHERDKTEDSQPSVQDKVADETSSYFTNVITTDGKPAA